MDLGNDFQVQQPRQIIENAMLDHHRFSADVRFQFRRLDDQFAEFRIESGGVFPVFRSVFRIGLAKSVHDISDHARCRVR